MDMNISLYNKFHIVSATKNNHEPSRDVLLYIHEFEDSYPLLRQLSSPIRNTLTTIIIISVLVGSCSNVLLYRYILVSSKLINGSYFKMTPVNVLLLNSTIIHHVVLIYTAFFLSLSIGTDIVLEEAFGGTYCIVTRYLGNNQLNIF